MIHRAIREQHGRPRQLRRGFTLVELLIVIVVIAILAAITIVAYNGVQSRSRASSVQASVSQAVTKLGLYYVDNNSYPSDLSTAGLSNLTSGSNVATYVPYTSANNRSGYCIEVANGSINYYASDVLTSPQVGSCDNGTVNGTVCPAGYIAVPPNTSLNPSEPNGFCVMKYEAKNNGSGGAVSVAAGTPWVSISQTTATSTSVAACSGCHLITEPEWMTIAANVLSVPDNWSGGSVGNGYIYSGHNDNAPASTLVADTTDTNGYINTGNTSPSNQRRTLTLTNGEVIWDFAGNAWEWDTGTIAGGAQPGLAGESAYAWKEWSNPSLLMNGLPATSRPSAISSQVAGWGSAQGIGKLYSEYTETATNSYIRGGYFGDTVNSSATGVLALSTQVAPSFTFVGIGFRVAK